MTPPDRLNELTDLFDRARALAKEVGDLLQAGRSGAALIAGLKEQTEVVARFRALLAEFRPERSLRTRSEIRRRIGRMQTEFEDLVKATEANHRLAARKGVRLAGVGGKPHAAPRAPASGESASNG